MIGVPLAMKITFVYMQLFSKPLNVQFRVQLSLVGSTFEGIFSRCLIFYCLHVLSRVAWAASILII